MNAWLTHPNIEDFCKQAVLVLADSAAKGVLILLAAWLVVLAMKRSSAAARHLVWSLALGGLLVLPVLAVALPKWQLPILPRKPAAPAPVVSSALPATSVSVSPVAAAPAMPAVVNTQPVQATPPTPPVAAPPAPAKPISIFVWLMALWMGIALVTLVPLGAGLILVNRLIRNSACLDREPWPSLVASLSSRLALRRAVRLLIAHGPAMPLATGVFRPAVLLPAEARSWPDDKRRAVLLHELAHVRRWDCLTHILTRLACVVHWFNPLAWVALGKMQNERERACDDLALTSGARPADYANELLSIARAMQTRAATAAAAIPMARTSQLEGRLLSILDDRHNRREVTKKILSVAALLCVMIVGTLAVVRLTSPEVAPPPDKPQTKTAMLMLHAVVDDSLAARIKALSKPVATKSEGCAAYQLNSDALLESLRASLDEPSRLMHLDNRAMWLDKIGFLMAFTAGDSFQRNNPASPDFIQGSTSLAGAYFLEPQRNGAKFEIRNAIFSAGIVPGHQSAGMQYKGTIKSGTALVFMADVPGAKNLKPVHLCAWLSLSLPDDVSATIQSTTVARMIVERGPEALMAAAKASHTLTAAKTLDPGAPLDQWTRRRPDGSLVKLVAIGRPKQEPYRWWDPDGNPIAFNPQWHPDWNFNSDSPDYRVIFQTIGIGIESGDDPHYTQADLFGDNLAQNRIYFGFGYGPWTNIGTVKNVGDKFSWNGMEFTYDREPFGKNTQGRTVMPVVLGRPATNDYDFGLDGIDSNGAVIQKDNQTGGLIRFEKEGANGISQVFKPFHNAGPIDHYAIKARQYAWSEFSGFALDPKPALANKGPNTISLVKRETSPDEQLWVWRIDSTDFYVSLHSDVRGRTATFGSVGDRKFVSLRATLHNGNATFQIKSSSNEQFRDGATETASQSTAAASVEKLVPYALADKTRFAGEKIPLFKLRPAMNNRVKNQSVSDSDTEMFSLCMTKDSPPDSKPTPPPAKSVATRGEPVNPIPAPVPAIEETFGRPVSLGAVQPMEMPDPNKKIVTLTGHVGDGIIKKPLKDFTVSWGFGDEPIIHWLETKEFHTDGKTSSPTAITQPTVPSASRPAINPALKALLSSNPELKNAVGSIEAVKSLRAATTAGHSRLFGIGSSKDIRVIEVSGTKGKAEVTVENNQTITKVVAIPSKSLASPVVSDVVPK